MNYSTFEILVEGKKMKLTNYGEIFLDGVVSIDTAIYLEKFLKQVSLGQIKIAPENAHLLDSVSEEEIISIDIEKNYMIISLLKDSKSYVFEEKFKKIETINVSFDEICIDNYGETKFFNISGYNYIKINKNDLDELFIKKGFIDVKEKKLVNMPVPKSNFKIIPINFLKMKNKKIESCVILENELFMLKNEEFHITEEDTFICTGLSFQYYEVFLSKEIFSKISEKDVISFVEKENFL